MRVRRAGSVLVASLVGVLLAGCSNAAPNAELHLPKRNLAQWTLPLDQFREPGIDRLTVAADLLAQKCIEAAGYSWPVVTDELRAGPGESYNPAGRKLFNEHLAEKYGYGNSARTDLSPEIRQRERDTDEANRATGKDASALTQSCFEQARRRLGLTSDSSDNPRMFATELGFDAADEAEKDRTVRAASARWRTCMSKVGLPDLPEDPDNMPSPSISKLRPAIDNVIPIGGETNVPAEERRVAVADAECRASSGWARAEYNAEWSAEAKAIAAHADELERYAAKAKRLDERTEAVIASSAPSAG